MTAVDVPNDLELDRRRVTGRRSIDWMPASIGAGLLVGALAIAFRNAGLYPVVLSDEYRFSIGARLLPLADESIPSYLYFLIFRSTRACGDGFLTCGRLLNLLFFVAATSLIYAVARRVVGRMPALAIAALAFCGPLNTFTAYFMPESMYCFGFWLLVWSLAVLEPGAGIGRHALVGCTLGLLALVKPHALFLLPGTLILCMAIAWSDPTIGVRAIVVRASALVASAALVKFGMGYLAAGPAGLGWFGSYYAGVSDVVGSSEAKVPVSALVRDAAWSMQGHAMSLALLLGMPLAALIAATMTTRWSERASFADPRRRVLALSVLLVGPLLVVAAAFTASVAGQGPYETLGRLHARYYDFAFPLLMIAGCVAATAHPASRPVRFAVGAGMIALILLAALGGLDAYLLSLIDAPELHGIASHGAPKRIAALLGIIAVLAWMARPSTGLWIFLFACAPFIALKGTQSASAQLRERLHPDAYERGGMFAKLHASRSDPGPIHVLGDDASGVYRALFQIDDVRATTGVVRPDAAIGMRDWPASARWLLIVGPHPVVGVDVDRLDLGDFSLVRRKE